MTGKAFWVGLLLVSSTASIRGEDWPEWRGKGRHGVWSESNILDTFPAGGLKVRWRVPIGSGFSGPAVAGGRVFVTDFLRQQGTRGVERVLCLDERTGARLWSREWEVDYVGLMDTFATGPRATPTVDQARVYVLGAMGKLLCLDAGTGGIIWQRDYRQDFRTEVPVWGMTGAPLVDGDKLICLVGGQPNAKVVAFDKTNGKELWRALPSDSEPGYSPPFHVTVGGQRQVIIWHPRAVSSLDPDTGRLFWEVPFKVRTLDSDSGAKPSLPAGFLVLQWLPASGTRRPQACGQSCLERTKPERNQYRRSACGHRNPGYSGGFDLWNLQLWPVPVSGPSHRETPLGDPGDHWREGTVGEWLPGKKRRAFLYQQRPRRIDHRQAVAPGLPTNGSHAAHQANIAAK